MSISELTEELKKEGKPITVLVPLKYTDELITNDTVNGNILADNGEVAIVGVSLK